MTLEAEKAQGGIPSDVLAQLEGLGKMATAQADHEQRLKDHDTTIRSVSEKIREAADQRDEQVDDESVLLLSGFLNPNPKRLVPRHNRTL